MNTTLRTFSGNNTTTSNATSSFRNYFVKLLVGVLFVLGSLGAGAQNVTVNPGAGSYLTLKAAFDAINSGTHTGAITISITASTTEAAPAVLNASGAGAASYSSVVITPAGPVTVSGAIAAGSPLIDLNGADNVTINGLNTGGNSLTISNTTAGTTAGSSTIRFIGDASGNTITNTTILGSSASTSLATVAATVIFGTGTTTGNDNNTISGCNIGPAGANLPSKAIIGSGTSSAIENDNVQITGNNIFDFFLAGFSCTGINVVTGNEGWTISNNRFYETATRTFSTTALRFSAITLNNSTGSFTVSGNTIGFAAANGTGTMTITGSSNEFRGIDAVLVSGTAPATNIQNNTITAINQTSSRGSATTSLSSFIAVAMITGLCNATGNTIGSQDGSTTIILNETTATAGIAPVLGFYNFSVLATNISNNNIGSITIQSTGTTTGFRGILVNTTTGVPATINNNVIGGSVVAGAIKDLQVGSYAMYGIQNAGPNPTIVGNTIRNFTGNSNASATIVTSGIIVSGNTGAATISQNNISAFINSSGAVANSIYGMSLTLPVAANVVSKNFIHSFSLTSTLTGCQIWGISGGAAGTATYSNNMISLGLDTTGASVTLPCSMIGIRDLAGSLNNYFHNSVYIGGSGVLAIPTAANSYAFLSNVITGTRSVLNNAFYNARGNAVGGGTAHFAIGIGSSTSGLTSDYNDLFFSGTDGNLGVFNATVYPTLAAYRTATSLEAHSYSANPIFIAPAANSSAVNLHATVGPSILEGTGTTGTGVADDIDGDTRSATAPDLGADEFAGTSIVPVINTLSISPTGNQCTNVARTVTANITPVNPLTAVTLNYSVNGGAPIPVTMTGGNPSATSNWTGIIPTVVPANATVTWSVTATDGTLSSTKTGTSYKDEPFTGVTAAITATPSALCSGGTTTLTAALSRPLTKASGPGATTTSAAGDPFYHGYGGEKSQLIFLASELTALGFTAGNITSLSLNITSLGTTPLNGFSINMGHTAQNAAVSNTAITTGLTSVYGGVGSPQALVLGTNTFTLSTPFAWNGTSNIVISFNFSNNNTGGTSSTVTSDVAPFTSTLYIVSDNATPACLLAAPASGQACMGTNSNGTTSTRPTITFTANSAPAITSYSWSDGTNTATGNPANLVIATVPATVTLTATDGNGCTLTPAPTTPISASPALSALNVTAGSTTLCGGVTTNLTATPVGGCPNFTYVWSSSPSTGVTFSNPNISNPTFSAVPSPAVQTVYTLTCTVTDAATNTASNSTLQITVNPKPAATAASNSPVCAGNTLNLTGTTNVVGGTYSWTGPNGFVDATLTPSISGVTAAAAGTYNFSVTLNGCTSVIATTTVVIGTAAPSAVTITPPSPTICTGSSVGLTASGGTASASGNATLGTAVTLTSATGLPHSTAFCNRWAQYWNQTIYTAAELTAAGLSGGSSINSVTYTTTSQGDAANNTNFSIRIGNTGSSTLAAFQTTGLTTVYGPATYVHAIGANTITFSTPFVWDGSSNIILDVRQDGVDLTNSAITYFTAAADNKNIEAHTSTTSGTTPLQTLVANSTVIPAPTTTRLNIVLAYSQTLNPIWSWGPPASGLNTYSGANVTASPTSPTTYTATASVNGCTTANTVLVDVTPTNTVGGASSNPTVCVGTAIPTVTITTTGATGIANDGVDGANGLPAGTSATWSGNTITITGTPSTAVGSPFNYSIPLTGGCGSVNATGTITVNATNTAGPASSNPTVCVGTAIPTVTITTTGATGISNDGVDGANGLPAGTSATWSGNTITITGTPSTAVGSPFNYSIPLTGGCGSVNATGTITVNATNTAGPASSNPTVCVGTTIPTVTITTTGATGITNDGVSGANGLPAGVSATWSGNTITITGTPSTAVGSPFNYSIPLTGGCGNVNATGTITVNATNTAGLASSNPTVCVGTAIPTVTITTTGATGILNDGVDGANGLPAGTSATWSANTITITGTPSTAVGSPFNYSIPLTGGCGSVNATGTITVNATNTAGPASSNPTVCAGTAIPTVTITTTGATGISNDGVSGANGLPPGVSATWSGNTITITGTPSTAVGSPFNYSIPLTGGCGSVNATGTITVNAVPVVSAGSYGPVCSDAGSIALVGSPAGGTFSGTGVTGNSFDPSVGTQTITYTVTGACGSSATTVIVVNATPGSPTAGVVTTPICQGSTLSLTSSAVNTPYTMNGNSGVAFQDISGTGTAVTGAVGDDSEHDLTLPGTGFTFNGTNYTTARVGNNGALVFGAVGGDINYLNCALPTGIAAFDGASTGIITGAGNSVAAICANWDDMLPSSTAGATTIKTQLIGSKYIIQWSNEAHFNTATAGTVTFQIQLDQSNGRIDLVYPDMTYGGALAAFDSAKSSTIGLNFSATSAQQYSFNTRSLGSQSVSFVPNTLTYAWTGPNGFASALQNPTIPTATPAASGNYVVTFRSGSCTSTANVSAVVTPTNTAGAASSNPTVCAGTAIPTVTITTTGATGIANSGVSGANGLPPGVSATWSGNTITITGTPSTAVGSPFNYSIPLTGGCGSVNATGTITVNATNTAGPASSNPTVCAGTAIPTVTITTTGATGISNDGVSGANGLPPGVSATWSGNTITITGTPSTAVGSPFNYSIPLTGGCGSVNATGTITVNATNTAGPASSNPTVCAGTAIPTVTITTTGATGIANSGVSGANGLPAGVSATWSGNTITITGTPSTAVGSPFNYSIPLTGGCGSVNATGTITVNATNTAGAASSNPTVCAGTAIPTVTITTTGATGIANSGVSGANGLPPGVSATWSGNTITITGTPSTAVGSPFNYSIPLTGGCGSVNATGTITVNAVPVVSAGSYGPVCSDAGSITLVGSPAGGTFSGTGVTGNSFNPASGTQTITYTFSGACGSSATTVIVVNATPGSPTAGVVTTPICQGSTLSLTSSAVNTPYTVNGNSGVAFQDISVTGTTVPAPVVSDDSEHDLTLPFSFTFNGTSYTTARVGNNGALVFGAVGGNINYQNCALPTGIAANDGAATGIITGAGNSVAAICANWTDLVPVAGSIKTQTIGGTKYIIQWTNEAHYNSITGLPSSGTGTFQIQLDATGRIDVVYPDVTFATALDDSAKSATIGLNFSATSAQQYSFNTRSLVPNQSISFIPNTLTYAWTGPNGFSSALQNPTIPAATPLATGNYVVTFTSGSCSSTANVSATVTPTNTAGAASSNPTVCLGTAIPTVTITTTGATGISNDGVSGANGLPAGVSATWSANTITITGTPSTAVGSPFNYSIPLTGGCGTVNATGTITVITTNSAGAPSSSPTVCMNTAISPVITIATTGATGIANSGVSGANGLPAGVSATWSGNTITISGTPTTAVGSPFNYSIPLTGGCGSVNATGTITVTPGGTATISGTTTVVQFAPSSPNITFTGTGGSQPYTFTYTVNGGGNQTVVTTGGSSVTTVPQSTAATGTFTYTLVSMQYGNGCFAVITGPTTAVVTVVTALARPNLSPSIPEPISSLFTTTQVKNGYVQVTNGTANPTTGVVTFRISKPANFTLSIPTGISVLGAFSVNNNTWTITDSGFGYYNIVSTLPVAIPAGANIKIGYTLTAGPTSNTSGIMMATVLDDTGGSSAGAGDSDNTDNQSISVFSIN